MTSTFGAGGSAGHEPFDPPGSTAEDINRFPFSQEELDADPAESINGFAVSQEELDQLPDLDLDVVLTTGREVGAGSRAALPDEEDLWVPPVVTGNRTIDAGKAGGEFIFHELRRLWATAPGAFAGVNGKADHEEAFDRYFKLI